MSQLYSTGPANLYVSLFLDDPPAHATMAGLLDTVAASDIYFLGTFEKPPFIDIQAHHRKLPANIGGVSSGRPFDRVIMGESVTVSGVLNKWNELTYREIANRGTGTTRGTYPKTTIGTPIMSSGPGYTFCLWVQFPRNGLSPYSDMPDGYRFPGTILLGPDRIVPGAGSKRLLTFASEMVYKRSDGTWVLYDHDMTNIPAVPPVDPSGQNP